jgi:hypothetical protein
MKKTLLEKINKPIKLFKKNGGIVGVCEKGGRLLGKTLKGLFDVTKFIVEPPVSVVILVGVITYDYLKKEETKPLLLTGDSEPFTNTQTNPKANKIVDLELELEKETISLGAKRDIEDLLGLSYFDQETLSHQYRKKIKEVHPDLPVGSESLFSEIQKLMEEIRWKWFVDYNNLNEEDKQKFESLTHPSLRAKSYLFCPKYRNSEMVGGMKVISMASCLDDHYRCRDTTNNNIVFLTEKELAQYEQI